MKTMREGAMIGGGPPPGSSRRGGFDFDDSSFDSDDGLYGGDQSSAGISSTGRSSSNGNNEYDEVKEIEKMSKLETFRVNLGRVAVTLILLITTVAVTLTTYYFLNLKEYRNFEIAYEQFARTVADAAVEQQRDVRDSLKALSNAISVYAETNNATWPYFYLPKYESYAEDYKILSRAEFVGMNNIVTNDEREEYINWSTKHYKTWLEESHVVAYGNLDKLNPDPEKYNQWIGKKTPDGFFPDDEREYYSVRTTYSPPARAYGPITNLNIGGLAANGAIIESMLLLKNETLVSTVRPFTALPADEHEGYHTDSNADNPHSFFFHPVHEIAQDTNSKIVASLNSAVAWDASMLNLLPDNVNGIYCVIKNNCDQMYSYEIDGKDAYYRGDGDFHNTKYDEYEVVVDLSPHTHPEFELAPNHCMYTLHVYPSEIFKQAYDTHTPEIFAGAVAALFCLVAVVFWTYDLMVKRRNDMIVSKAARSNAIVTSLFPTMFRDRILNQGTANNKASSSKSKKGNSKSLKAFLRSGSADDDGTEDQSAEVESKPLADLFLNTTVIFADIVGFTAWSSVRQPSQVFTLLETVYSAFDKIAKKKKVFKVETVGDCYVAVTGLPNPNKEHAATMARFAKACMLKMDSLTKQLEITLGPDTGDLSLRIGIHSGPVTAGVLRGERSRFQLFGDTMNTAARIESTSERGKIQLSQETATLLINSGKENWITPRKDRIDAKGKGDIQTYWLVLERRESAEDGEEISESHMIESNNWADAEVVEDETNAMDQRTSRLVDWNTGMLLQLVKQIIARRNARARQSRVRQVSEDDLIPKGMPLDEVKEIITLPEFDSKAAKRQQDPETVEVPPVVVSQLRDYIAWIAKMYRPNSFHGFDHASHVVMSVIKLMSRIVAPQELEDSMEENGSDRGSASQSQSHVAKSVATRKKKLAASLHDHTYGITSDPLTQFACAFSALIHDVDHTGVPNPRLSEENPELGTFYKNRSVAEQNSFDLAFNMLMDPRYSDLRAALCADASELVRFRQLVVNSVMATDLGDKELKALRNGRWDKAFKKVEKPESPVDGVPVMEISTNEDYRDAINRKATIVIEHIIQASDVSHTMQHWHVYRKWNQRLFEEMYTAYKNGRAEKNPAEFWYKGEIGFFDFYIIPLAKKLKDCGVFGVSSDEFLNYATKNRAEWERKGQEVIDEMLQKLEGAK